MRVTFDANTVIEALEGKEPATELLDRAREGQFDLAVPEVVFVRLKEPTRTLYLERLAFAERISKPTAELGRAMLGRISLGGYPSPAIHGNQTPGGAGWKRTTDDADALAAHKSYGRNVFVTRDERLRRQAKLKDIATMTPEQLLAELRSAGTDI